MTDTDNQVTAFSSRGNVGIGVEGEFGRFKPDVVAPGMFVVSTRSQQWDTNAYYNPTNYSFFVYPLTAVSPDTLNNYNIFIPANAVAAMVRAEAVNTNLRHADLHQSPRLPVDERLCRVQSGLPADRGRRTGDKLVLQHRLSDQLSGALPVTEIVATTNDNGNYFEVLQRLND